DWRGLREAGVRTPPPRVLPFQRGSPPLPADGWPLQWPRDPAAASTSPRDGRSWQPGEPLPPRAGQRGVASAPARPTDRPASAAPPVPDDPLPADAATARAGCFRDRSWPPAVRGRVPASHGLRESSGPSLVSVTDTAHASQ